MRGVFVFNVLFLFCTTILPAQIALDSLRKVAANESLPDTSRLEAMNGLANHYYFSKLDSMGFFGELQLALAQASGNQAAEGRARQVLGTFFMRKGEMEKAYASFRSGIALSEKIGNTYLLGKTYHELAAAFMSQGKIDSAKHYFQQALIAHEEIGNQRAIAAALGGLGSVARSLSDFDQAQSYYERALEVFDELGDLRAQGIMLRNIAFLYVTRNNYEKGLAYCLKSLALFEEIGDQREMASVLGNIGLTYYYMAAYDSALVYQLKSLDLTQVMVDKRGISASLGNLGMIYDRSGNAELALENYEKSLAIKEEIGDKPGIATTLRNISKIYRDLGDNELSLDFAQRSLALHEEMGNRVKIAGALYTVASALLQTGADSLAHVYARKSLEIGEELGIQRGKANALIVLGKIYHREEKRDSAEQVYQRALQLAEESNELEAIGGASISLASLALDGREWSKANRFAKRALLLAREANSVGRIKGAANILWQSQEALGQTAAAFESYQLYIQMRDSISGIANQRAAIRYEFKQQALTDSLQNASLLNAQIEENKRRQTVSNFLFGGLGITLVFGLILFNRFRVTSRQKTIIEEEKVKMDQANQLLNQTNDDLNAANEKLKELDTFKSQFFTNISHEFRTPLTVISGMTQQVKQQPEKWGKKGIDLIDRNAKNLLHLIKQILDLRKLESGKLSLSLVQANVIQALRLSTASFESMAESKEIDLEFVTREAELMMDFDPEKLGQITNNLLSNAIKFTQEGGSIQISVGADRQAAPTTKTDQHQASPTQLLIVVADTGKGIPAEKLPYIFDRFYQVDGTDTREGEGTGVGLSLTRELVHLMGGEISVESMEGKGTTFRVLLPIEQNEAITGRLESPEASEISMLPVMPTSSETSSATTSAELPRLLIIEDNPDIVSYLYSLLEDQYELSSAPDGQKGIEVALEEVPDLIITDVMMPHKNGYEVTEALKLDERTSHIPIVMLTAKADQSSKLEGYKRGADAYLAKPFDKEELMIRLRTLWEIRQRLQARYQQAIPPRRSEDPAVEMEDAFISKVRVQILSKIDEAGYRGEALCEDLGLSRSNLYRKLKALTGLSIAHFIRSVRLDFAKERLLQQPDLMVAEIAYASGFNDPAYFNRVFSEVHGLSPGEWRETNVGK